MLKRHPRRKTQNRDPGAQPLETTHRFRIHMIMWAFILVYAAIGARLVQLQIDPSVKFSKEDVKHVGTITLNRPRGDILDRNGRVLATDKTVFSLSANPSAVSDVEGLAALVGKRLGLAEDFVKARLGQHDSAGGPMKFVWIKRRLSRGELAALGELSELPGGEALTLTQESVRFYPEGELAAPLLGFANREGRGAAGLELTADVYLRSTPGHQVSRVDNKRNLLGYLTLEHEAPTGGHHVRLTLDASFQYKLEQELDAALERNNAPRGMGILMDPHTGAVLALATRPAFDPNHYGDYGPEKRKNRAVLDVFEPGSAFKIVTAAAALELGLITPEDEIDCENGSFNPYGHRIKDVHKLGVVPFTTCFAQSSNIAMIKVAALLGPERLEEWIHRFQFGRKTGLGLAGESAGIFRPRRRWSRLSMGSLPIGQEIAVTIVQLARAFAVIANGGFVVTPYLIDEVRSRDGKVVFRHEIAEPTRILSEKTASVMKDLCHLVVSDPESTGSLAAIPEYRVGGKTGTAQIARPDGKGYYRDRYTTIFAGFAPVDNPRICAVIVVQEPMVRNHYGGYVCGPVFRNVVRDVLTLSSTPKDPMLNPVKDQAVGGLFDEDTIVERLAMDLLEPLMEKLDGVELIAQVGDERPKGPLVPNLIGMTKRQAKERVVELGLQWDPQGMGRVVYQRPAPGTPLGEAQVCRLVFSPAGK